MVLFIHYGQSQINSQNPYEIGNVRPEELHMTDFPADPTANSLVLYERGNVSFHGSNNTNFYFVTKVYRKIKILNEQGYSKATVKVYLDKNSSGDSEKIENIRAFTHNLNEKPIPVSADRIFTKNLSEKYDEVSFTFPNVKPGSVLEYQYEVESEFFFNLVGWSFQSDIPKLFSEFHATIPGFWNYNRHLNGSLSLTTNQALVKNNCFEIRGASASCEELTYAIKDIPAFKEDEDYSLASKNYLSKIEFELSRINYPDGTSKGFTSTWKDTDNYLELDRSVGKQLKLSSYFKKTLPKELFKIKDDHQRARSLYYYMQDHFNLDKENTFIYSHVNVKKAYEEKNGSMAEINMALINALNAVGLDAKIMLLSTRDNGIPTKTHPILTDFNYVVAYLKIDDTFILLDASNRFMAFGQTPFKTLNGQGRVLDFDNGSYWHSTSPKISSMQLKEIVLKLDEEDGLNGNVVIKSTGYDASRRRQWIDEMTRDDYMDHLQSDDGDMMVNNYSNEQLKQLDSTLTERFDVEFEAEESMANELFLNPFLYRYKSNPFQLEERTYPVNFGYKINDITKTSIEIPSGYKVKSLPQPVHIKLPNNGGSFVASFAKKDNRVLIYSNLKINYPIYNPEKYKLLKEMFKGIIKTNNSLISLEKTSGS